MSTARNGDGQLPGGRPRVAAYANDYGRPATPDWRALDWAARERDVLLSGRRLHHVDHGSGQETFLLIHGMGGRWQHWMENIPALGQRGRVVAVDLPGFGRAAAPRSGYSLDGFADTAAALCHELGLTGVVCAGHSLGGSVAVRFAVRHPELARAIVPVSGAVDLFSDVLSLRGIPAVARLSPRTVASTLFEVLTAGLPAPARLRRRIAAGWWTRQAVLWPYLREPARIRPDTAALLLDGAGARGVLPTARAVALADPFAGVAEVRCPILVVNADDDPISPVVRLAGFTRATVSVESVVIEGTGHMLMLERPDAFNAELARFLDTLGE
ncbi:alpha/beta fold hydrolase [Streptomyces longwoodensis]|uniref:alpha/beta fold hydrolase n=1 Tax=Streptomyces longwoodensis TaxID=68231 RepID=UPI0033E6A6E3